MSAIIEVEQVNRRKVLQIGPMSDFIEQQLAIRFEVTPWWKLTDKAGWLAANAAGHCAIVTSARHGCGGELITMLPDLKVIGSFGVGMDSIDIQTAKERSVVVSNTPDLLTDCVADLALGLIIDVARRISEADRFVRNGSWPGQPNFAAGRKVTGKRLGIVGLGSIGKAVARRAAAFDMQIRYHGRRRQPAIALDYEVSLTALAEWADFLVVAVPGGTDTRGLISASVIETLGKEGVLINVARGAVVDQAALVDALVGGRLGGAGLDVYLAEPIVPEALLALPNVVLLPHIGSATVETRRAMEALLIDNLDHFFGHGKLLSPAY